ncbi:MAG: hypothetical protein ABL893_17580, partial [Hyphomicrobium sp.]
MTFVRMPAAVLAPSIKDGANNSIAEAPQPGFPFSRAYSTTTYASGVSQNAGGPVPGAPRMGAATEAG